MSSPIKILAFSGSLRADSWNHRLVELASNAARAEGATVDVIRLRDYPLPLFDQDHEDAHGLPEAAVELKRMFLEHDGLLVASPEYNGSYSAALKNVVDWMTRPHDGRSGLDCFRGKVAGLLSCSPGQLGGIRGLPSLRHLLSSIGTMVVPHQVAVPGIHDELNESDVLRTERLQEAVDQLGREVVRMIRGMRAGS
ncbi:MAG: NAD(P)H-dependent oxidoreductase [Planctomycetota bacterium]|nr:NAD(P)H-dependent oxidoreductase [Planctomycetota bacterium]